MKNPSNRLEIDEAFQQIEHCSLCQLLHNLVMPHLSRDNLHDMETAISLYLPDGMPLDINIYTGDHPYIPDIVLHVFKCKGKEKLGGDSKKC